jgi:hypothetical protein
MALTISRTTIVALIALSIALCQAFGVPVVVRIPVLLGLLVYCGVIAVRGTEFANPISVFIISWSVVWALYCSQIVIYDWMPEGSSPYIYLLACCVIVPLSASLTKGSTRPKESANRRPRDGTIFLSSVRRNKPLINICAVAGIASGVLYAYETFFLKGANPLDAVILRALVVENREATIYSQIGSLLQPGGLVSLCGALLSGKVASRPEKALWIAGAVGSCSIGVMAAGRQTVFQVCVIMLITLALQRRLGLSGEKSKLRIWIFGAVIAVIFAYMVGISILRSADSPISKDKYVIDLRFAQGHVEETIDDRFEDLPGFAKDSIIETITYASAPITNFAVLWHADIGEPQWGLFGFPFLTRRVRELFPNVRSDLERMQAYIDAMEAMGKSGHVWFTTVRDFVFDFGYTGALIVVCLYGVLAQKAVHLFSNFPTFGSAMVIVSASIVAAYFPLLSALSDTNVVFFTILAVWLAIKEKKASLSRRHEMPGEFKLPEGARS